MGVGLSGSVTVADVPNIFIMIAALISLFIMLVIFLRNMEFIGIVGEGAHAQPWPAAMPPPRLLMQRVHIPFTFKLLEPHTVSYAAGVRCAVTSTVPYWYASWWGAPVRQLHAMLWGEPRDMRAARQDARSNKPHGERVIEMSCGQRPRLGPPPRACYPLVVILARELAETHDLRPDDTVALVSVIHIKDEQCALPTGIIAQYLKQANGHLSCLKRLYVAGEGGTEQDGYAASVAEDGALCCVCASQPLSRALLPCRHACLCADCLPKLDKCPICRSTITSYFCIKNEEEPLSELKQQRFPFNRRILDLFHYH